MSDICIREAKVGDAKAIAKIHVETWQYAYKGQLPDSFLTSLSIEKRQRTWKKNLSEASTKARVFVGEINGNLTGFCSVGACRDDDADKTVGELFAIYVDSKSMGKGVGSALMQKGLEYLKQLGFRKATLWVLTSNTKTREFYEHKGWVTDGKIKTDHRKGFDMHETRYAIVLE